MGTTTIDVDPQDLLKRCRVSTPRPTPQWVLQLPENLKRNTVKLLLERHHYKEGKVWGLARGSPEQAAPFEEVGTARFLSAVKRYGLEIRVPGYSEQAKRDALVWWQSWQDPHTGRFHDPDDRDRLVNEKYVVSIIRSLGCEPLYPHSTTSATGQIDTAVFLQRTRSDPDWQRGGWGVGSHTGFMAVELYNALNNEGRDDLIGDLEQGIGNILSHQNPDGLWGPVTAPLAGRIGGALKVIGRLYGRMGLVVPHTRELADTLVAKQDGGEFNACSVNDCPQRNEAEMIAYCLETSAYRRQDLHKALASVAQDLCAWVNDDGSVSHNRGEQGGMFSAITYALGICGAYLNWQDCPFKNPLEGFARGISHRYRVTLTAEEQVKIVKRF